MKSGPLKAVVAALLSASAVLPLQGCLHGCSHREHNDTSAAANVQQVVATPQLAIMKWSNYSDYQPVVQQFYAGRNYALAWTDAGAVTPQATAMMEQFSNAADKGLKPEDYDASRWAERVAKLKKLHDEKDTSGTADDLRAQFDAAMTISAMRYLSDLHVGRINPQQLDFDIDVPARRAAFDLPGLLENQLTSASDVPSVIGSVEPSSPIYAATETALPQYLALAKRQADAPADPLPTVTKSLDVGATYAAANLLAARLQLTGELAGDATDGDMQPGTSQPAVTHPAHRRGYGAVLHRAIERARGKAAADSTRAQRSATETAAPAAMQAQPGVYTQQLSDAVRTFQQRHGLTVDGKLSAGTVAALNVPMSARVQQIDDSLERWRWLPEEYQQPRFLINLPEFVVRTYNADHSPAFAMNVIDGKNDGHDTPVFVREMRYVVFRPFWVLPVSIIKKDIVRHDKAWMDRNNYEVVGHDGEVVADYSMDDLAHARYMVRQKPGPKNSLGLIKFIFPNEYDIYMHSTPEVNLFNLTVRDKSHGCVRLQDVEKMADWVLDGQGGWDDDKIHTAIYGPDGADEDEVKAYNNKTYNLKQPLPVSMMYLTAMPGDDGTLHFFNDVYGYDKAMDAILAKGRPYPNQPAKINPKVTPGETE